MVKTQDDHTANKKSNKTHKTLRQKLRKKREELKTHKKEKRQKHKQYDAEEKKKKFFEKKEKKKRQDGIKEHRIKKHIEKFVDIYEDDVEEFYGLFKILDEGGLVDIGEVENPKMQKCLKKMFKYLPLNKAKLEYKKKQTSKIKLQVVIKELVTKVIENYLENGTQSEMKAESSSEEQKDHVKKQGKSKEQKKQCVKEEKNQTKYKDQTLEQMAQIKLYAHQIEEEKPQQIGPFIPPEQRQKLAQLFEEQLKKEEQQIIEERNKDEQHFNQIFGMSTGRKKQKKGNIDDIPDHLLAEGSAKIGQKQQIDDNQIEEYNKIYRPRKLIEEHQEMKKLGKYAQQKNQQRLPFNRQRDIVNGGKMNKLMKNGVFFDFKDKMSKPKTSNSFL